MRITPLALIALLLQVLTGTQAHAQASFVPGTGDQMLKGMMNMMGQFAQQVQGVSPGSMMSQGAGLMANSPAATLDPSGGQLMQSIPGFQASGSSPLDGAWQGSRGEYLLIEGERFRLHAADSQRHIDGSLRTQGNIVGFLYPERQAALMYRYRVEEDRMALQDQNGNVLLYRKVASAK